MAVGRIQRIAAYAPCLVEVTPGFNHDVGNLCGYAIVIIAGKWG